jgi:hypothetical protein
MGMLGVGPSLTSFLVNGSGWLGAAVLLLAYALVSFKKMQPDSGSYQLMNAAGSALLIVNTVYYHAFPSAFVNLIWIFIAIVAYLRARNRGTPLSNES